MQNKKLLKMSPMRSLFLSSLALSLMIAGLSLTPCGRQNGRATRPTSPDSLSAYRLKADDRQMLAEWGRWHRHGQPDSLREWVRRHYGPLQSIGLRLMEQATLFQDDGQMALATAKFDTARKLGETLADAVNDSFLLRQVTRVENLDTGRLRSRAQASRLFAQAEDRLYAGQYAGKNEAGLEQYEEIIALAQQAGDAKLDLDARYRLLFFHDRLGQNQPVVAIGEEILAGAQRVGYQYRSTLTLCQIANACKNLGQDSTALLLVTKAIELAEKMRDHGVLARCYNNQAKIHFRREEYQRAEMALQRVIQYDREQRFRGLAHLMQGQIDFVRGEYGRAQIQYELALNFFRKYEPDHLNEAVALNNLSTLNIITGDYEHALQIENQALALRQAANNQKELAESLSNLGFIYNKLDSVDRAIARSRQALPLFQEGQKIFEINTWLNLAKAYLRKSDLPAANAALTNAEKIAAAVNNQTLMAETQLGQGLIALKQGEPEPAKNFFTAALNLARLINDANFVATALLGLSQAEQKLSHPDSAMEFIGQAIAHVENLRSGISRDSIRVSYFATTQELFDQAILLTWARGQADRALHYAERARARALRDALDNTAFKKFLEERWEVPSQPVPSLQALQQRIPSDVQIVEYRLTADTLLIWLIDRRHITTRRIATSSQTLTRLVDKFLSSLGAVNIQAFKKRAAQNLQKVYHENRQIGYELCQLIWEPIAKAITPDKRLFILPDGPLYRLPFGALVTADGHFFEEKYIYVKAPSLAILAESSSQQASFELSRQTSLLMVADAVPSAGAQTKLLSRLFVKPSFLIKEAATYESLQEHLHKGATIVYFSVHAVADERFPLNSYIELYRNAGMNGAAQKAKVYARELLQLNFTDTRLVVLNACETASGKIAAGEGVLNLVRIFTLRQVPVVIASLWKNDDRVSSQITGEFFKSIANSMDLPLALHQAKLQALQKLRQDYQFPLPYFWAVFEVYQNGWDMKHAVKLNQPIGEKHVTSSR